MVRPPSIEVHSSPLGSSGFLRPLVDNALALDDGQHGGGGGGGGESSPNVEGAANDAEGGFGVVGDDD